MSWSGDGSCHIECPYCGQYMTARGMYWHLVIDHHEDRREAYDIVGNLLWDEYHDMSSGKYHGPQPEWRR